MSFFSQLLASFSFNFALFDFRVGFFYQDIEADMGERWLGQGEG
jgi:hypothetical protein